MSEVLKVEGLGKSFGSERVIDGLDLSLKKQQMVTILGKSGVGKSVLLRCLSGLMMADEGEVLFLGEKIFPQAVNPSWQTNMGYLFQGDALFEHLSVEENVALPLTETSGKRLSDVVEVYEPLLEKLDLWSSREKRPGEISGGMRRRVALARCLVRRPDLVLFDEPTTGLDPIRSRAVFEMIRERCDDFGFSALVVSHDVDVAGFFYLEIFLTFKTARWIMCGDESHRLYSCGSILSHRSYFRSLPCLWSWFFGEYWAWADHSSTV